MNKQDSPYLERRVMRKLIAGALAPLAIAGTLLFSAGAAQATDYGVDMNTACRITNGQGYQAELTYPSQGAYGWRCWVPPWGVRKGVSVQAYCDYYGLGTAVVLNASDPYSWRCRT